MPATPRPPTEWIFDDLGRMKFKAVYDFTSAEFGENIGVVLAFTESPGEVEDGQKRVQLAMRPEIAAALVEALTDHLRRLRV